MTDDELDLIKQKMVLYGTENMSAYLRKLAIDGYVLKLDLSELKERISLMRCISNNENRIAEKLNSTDKIYDTDFEEIKKNQAEIRDGIKQIIASFTLLD